MELAKQERELAKPINWGERTYWSMRNREKELHQQQTTLKRSESTPIHPSYSLEAFTLVSALPLDSVVRKALEDNPTQIGPLKVEASVLDSMTEEEQCSFFACYRKLQNVVLQRWMSMSKNVIRCISMTFGESLIEADFSYSAITAAHLEIILVRTDNLKILKLDRCPLVNTAACSIIVQLAHRNLVHLSLHACPLISSEGLLWLGGSAGAVGNSMRKLKFLDIGECADINDRGVISIAKGCPRLQCLNFEELHNLTDQSILALTEHCANVQLANFMGCQLLTSKSIVAIGKKWPKLLSLNLSRCKLVTDKGLKSIAFGCKSLQAINLAGLLKVSEESMFCLADQCKGLLTMNITGCERITINGLNNLVLGLSYVEKAVSFFGFKPVDQHIALKLENQLRMIEQNEIFVVQRAQEIARAKQQAEQEAHDLYIYTAAKTIQEYCRRYNKRMYFYAMWVDRVRRAAALFLQRVYRGYRGRLLAIERAKERAAFLANSPFAALLQKTIRAFLVRRKNGYISKRIREMYMLRQREAIHATIVPLQAFVRKSLAKKRVTAIRLLHRNRLMNMHAAATLMQVLARQFLAKMCLIRMRIAKHNYDTALYNAGKKIARFCIEGMRRYKAKLSGDELRRFFRHKWTASELLQRVYRGYRARERVRKLQIEKAVRYYAARSIQRVFRGTRILHWRDMRLNVIAAYVLDRHYVERRESVENSRRRYRAFVAENLRDSASEPDDEDNPDDFPFTEGFDEKRKRPFWQNYITNEITFDEPPRPLALERNLLYKRCRVFWMVQGTWYEGTIVKYHKRKRRHRIEYDDGDHEWLNLANEGERVQIQLDDGTYAMYAMYEAEARVDEVRKVEDKRARDDYKAQAFKDARQWRAFTDDHSGTVMFYSEFTGELRAAALGALDWVVQDDGFGFPCFYNQVSQAVVYEDPRFTYDVADDVQQQRKYVMQEVRLGVYVCKDLWERYSKALLVNDPRQLDTIMFKIRNTPKITQLSAFVIRAKALHTMPSIVDKPMFTTIYEELDYAQWLVNRLGEVVDQADRKLMERADGKRRVVDKLTANNGKVYYCRNCQRETQRHLDFCPHCGKQQIFM